MLMLPRYHQDLPPASSKTSTPSPCFEIRDAGNKGVGVFATRTIPAGTLIVKETPILTFPKNNVLMTPEEVETAYAGLSKEGKKRFNALRTIIDMPNRCTDPVLAVIDTSDPFWMIFLHFNSNACSSEVGCGVYDIICRFNHACVPDAERVGPAHEHMECRANSDILKGEEITVCYSPYLFYMTFAERCENMPEMGFKWICECQLCAGPLAERQVSDMRRRLLRHLTILTKGFDIPNVIQKLDAASVRQSMLGEMCSWNYNERNTVLIYLTATLLDAKGAVIDGEAATMYSHGAN